MQHGCDGRCHDLELGSPEERLTPNYQSIDIESDALLLLRVVRQRHTGGMPGTAPPSDSRVCDARPCVPCQGTPGRASHSGTRSMIIGVLRQRRWNHSRLQREDPGRTPSASSAFALHKPEPASWSFGNNRTAAHNQVLRVAIRGWNHWRSSVETCRCPR